MDFYEACPWISCVFKHLYPSPKIYYSAYYIFTLTDCIKRCLISQSFYKRVCLFNIIWTARMIPRACITAMAKFPAILGNKFIRGKYNISHLTPAR